MAAKKLHDGEVDIDAARVRRLLVTQFPHLCDLPVEEVQSTGTVNAIYRLGDDLCVRLPRVERWAGDLEKELEWLPKLAPRLSLAVPEPVAKGEPGSGYPLPWAIYSWLTGETFATDRVVDEQQAAADLAQFVAELRRIDLTAAPGSGRKPLPHLDSVTRYAIDALRGIVDTDAATAAGNVASKHRCGTEARYGGTAISSRQTCSSKTAGSKPSSTSGPSVSAIPPPT